MRANALVVFSFGSELERATVSRQGKEGKTGYNLKLIRPDRSSQYPVKVGRERCEVNRACPRSEICDKLSIKVDGSFTCGVFGVSIKHFLKLVYRFTDGVSTGQSPPF